MTNMARKGFNQVKVPCTVKIYLKPCSVEEAAHNEDHRRARAYNMH